MEKIVWTPELSVGVNIFSEHHKRIILMINRLVEAQEAATNSETVSDLLDKMMKFYCLYKAKAPYISASQLSARGSYAAFGLIC